jgi:hypothetical protein
MKFHGDPMIILNEKWISKRVKKSIICKNRENHKKRIKNNINYHLEQGKIGEKGNFSIP